MENNVENSEELSADEIAFLEGLYYRGFCPVIFTPKELNGADCDQVMDAMIAAGYEKIDFLTNFS